jgi:glyoxylase-like metal-dependent hydrolase (beta-lactamase superfamily II)
MNRIVVAAFLVTALTLSARGFQGPPAGAPPGGLPPPPQQQGPKVVEAQKVKDNLYVLTGGGGNTTLFVTANNGAVVIDTKLPGWGQVLQDKIRSLTDKPVTTVINTHTHADHTSGNVEFPPTVNFVVQANTKVNMEKMDLFKGESARYLPKTTFQDRLSLFSGADRVDLYYFGLGGTNGDAWIVIPALRTLIAGDAFAAKAITLIDKNNGGSATGYLDTLQKLAATVAGVDTIITGHDGVLAWNDLLQYIDLNREFQAWIRAEKQMGKTVDQAAMEYKLPEKYQGFNPPNPRGITSYIQSVFDETR